MITPNIFSKSFFYIGPGFDFEPLIRFSNLTDTFIYVNLYLSKEEVKKSIIAYLANSEFLEFLSIKEYDDFDEIKYFTLSKNYRQELYETFSVFNSNQKLAYQNAFLNAISENQWMLDIDLVRKGLDRKIKFYYMTAEGLSSYIALSHNGKYPPYILSTIQTEVLEFPNGLMSLIFKHTKSHPSIWVRGIEENSYNYFDYRKSPHALRNNDSIFNVIGSDFAFSWIVQGTYINELDLNRYTKRYCKAYITEEYRNKIKREKDISIKNNFIHTDGISSILKKINPSSKTLILFPSRLNGFLDSIDSNIKISFWEDLFQNNSQKVSLQKSLDFLASVDRLLEFDEVHFIPYGLEDEGRLLRTFLESNTSSRFHVYLHRPLDFIDITNSL